MAMKLYYGGYGDYLEYTVAETEENAVENIGKKINAPFLPITAKEISEIDGYAIQAVSKNVETPKAVEPTADTSSELAEEKPLRHCKKCDFACETQGELLKHYREKHPKGD